MVTYSRPVKNLMAADKRRHMWIPWNLPPDAMKLSFIKSMRFPGYLLETRDEAEEAFPLAPPSCDHS